MSFSQEVKNELRRLKESGDNKKALNYGLAYCTEGQPPFIDARVCGSDETAGLFLRGVFLSRGIVAAPEKEYHLEISVPDGDKLAELLVFINERGIPLKQSARGGKGFIYGKDSETIADFLTYIGAVHHAMEIMNAKIYKEVRNNVNRAVNCEAANIGKTARAAGKQLDDIEYILRVKGHGFLPRELREVALARRGNVEMSLKEIGESLGLSKSGVNHRLKKIGEIAEALRENEQWAK